LQTPAIKFDERSIIRWTKNSRMNSSPIVDQWYDFAEQNFQSVNGCWVFNGRFYSGLDEVKSAIEDYNAKIEGLLAKVADS